jgi:hypothetical protein
VGEEGVALEDRVGRPLVRRNPQGVLVIDHEPSLGDLLEPGDHAQRRCLAAAARAEHGEELTLLDVEVDSVDRGDVAEPLGDRLEDDALAARPFGRGCDRTALQLVSFPDPGRDWPPRMPEPRKRADPSQVAKALKARLGLVHAVQLAER